MSTIPLNRLGINVGRKLPLEDAIGWAAQHDVGIIDIQLDTGANVVTSFDLPRAHAIRRACEYLKAYIDTAVLLGAEWVVVHAGFHFPPIDHSACRPVWIACAGRRTMPAADRFGCCWKT
jgi:hypothetical protein